MQTPFEKKPTKAYYELLEGTAEGAKQIAGSKMSEEKYGNELRDHINELRTLCGIFEGYKQTGDTVFISKAEEYLFAWAREYAPDTTEKGVQISLDQRFFSWVFIEAADCWEALSAKGKNSAVILAEKVLQEEEKFWATNKNHNNRYSYSVLTRMTALGVLEKSGNIHAHEKMQQATHDLFEQVRENIYEDGSTLDFRVRDSVHYQVFNQIAWETSRKYLKEHFVEIPTDVLAKLDLSLNFSLKYINGDETHLEFVNSTHARDAEIQGEKIGKHFDKKSYVARQLLAIVEEE